MAKAHKVVVYCLIDEFSCFYLKWMKSKPPQKAGHWQNVRNSPRLRTEIGYAFESFCHQHIDKLEEVFGISSVQSEVASWTYIAKNDHDLTGPHFGLLIDRNDGCINVCVMQFTDDA